MTTYYDLVQEALVTVEDEYPEPADRAQLRDLMESGEIHDRAHEYADGHADVIYYSNSRNLWADGVSTEYEADASDLGPFDSIDAWISAAAYCTLRAAYTDAVSEYLDSHEDDDTGGAVA